MEKIDRHRLYNDLTYRFKYVSSFIGFGEEDKKVIKESATYLAPLVPTVVDAVYKKLFSYDITKLVFLQRMDGYSGVEANETNLADSEQIRFRKDMLTRYLTKLVTSEYTAAFVNYLDWVALIHTQNKNKASSINVEYIHINALLGYVQTILTNAIMNFPVENDVKTNMLMAFNKLLWIQNDFFAQYYTYDGTDVPDSRIVKKGVKLPKPSKECAVRES